MSDGIPTSASANDKALRFEISYDRAINYAFQQNAIPVVKELRLRNDVTPRKALTLRITTEPAFATPIDLHLQSLDAEAEFRVAPLDIKLSHDFLATLSEKVAGWLRMEILEEERVIHSQTEPVSLLARNEWCGLISLPEILAAFVLPNDPAVMTILSRAAEILREHTGRAAFNGYQDKNRKRVWEQLAAIYKSIAELGIRYISPPASFENTGQKVRFPSDILAQRFGTCLDLSLLFAACCEQIGLHPLILMHEGHAYAGCWLEERTLPESSMDDLQQVRKLAVDSLITVFETTIVASESPGTLPDAELLARPHLETKSPFRLALDIRRARIARISPLPILGQTSTTVPGAEGISSAAAVGIGNRDFAENLLVEPKPSTKSATRIDQWKSRLLDLSLRNRLLNFKPTKSTIQILSASPEHVEDELAAAVELSLQPKPKLMGEDDPRNAATYTKQQRADALSEHLRDELKHGRLRTGLDDSEHSRRLTELYRAARSALDENGTNTLFAAVGILEWRETEHSDRVLRAPLLLVPVELIRKSVLEGFTLRRIDEDTRLNVTLMEMLRQQFHKEIPGLDPLPEDQSGVDVARIFQLFRDAVRDLVGWEVKVEVWLGQFSFTKFLLWKDLTDRLDDLTQNRIVRHLVHEAGGQYPNPPDDIRPAQLDDQFHPRDVFCPRSADSSQLAAVMAAAAGHDFVLEGPPGTGKSQTITNIISHCLAHGKRVLFVAEKRAALDVVHRRLREEGLEPFCLELHSNKTGKADVLAQFERCLKLVTDAAAPDWERRATELEKLRRALNDYARTLHRRHPCGLSAYQCLDYLLPRQTEPTVRLDSWAMVLGTTADTLERARELARLLQERSRTLIPLANHPLALLAYEDWSPAWAERTLDRARELSRLTQSAIEATCDLRTWLRLPGTAASRLELGHLTTLVHALLAPEPVGPAFATTPWNQLAGDLDSWITLIRERTDLRAQLSGIHLLVNPSSTLPSEEWSSSGAEQIFGKARELGALTKTAIKAAHDLRAWLHVPSVASSRRELVHLVGLVDALLTSAPVGAAFATTSWNQLASDLDSWIALLRERTDLRAKLGSLHTLPDPASTLPSEDWSSSSAERIFGKARELGVLTKTAVKATYDLRAWLGVPAASSSRMELVQLVVLVDNLLTSAPVGGDFATTPWNEWVTEFDNWIALVRERVELRTRLVGYDELKLLTLDLDFLTERWQSAKTAWFLPKWLRIGTVRRQLRKARPDQSRLEADTMGDVLQAAKRLRSINGILTAANAKAVLHLGTVWANGQPQADLLLQVRTWGEALHSSIVACAGDNRECLGQLRKVISGLFRDGQTTYGPGTIIGNRLSAYREGITQFDEAFEMLADQACLKRKSLDDALDHLSAVTLAITSFLEAAQQVRVINSSLLATTPSAQAILGRLWANGEPQVDLLSYVRTWGAALHSSIEGCAGGDVDWLGQLRELIAGLFRDGQTAYGPGTVIGNRLNAYREAITQFDEALEPLAEEARFQRKQLDDASDHLAAVDTAITSFLGAAPRIRTINASLTATASSAQPILGTLWAKGEPSVDALVKVRNWGEPLHAHMVKCAGDDLIWLGQLRNLLAGLFTEGPAAYASDTIIGSRLICYRDTQIIFNEAFTAFAADVRLQRDPLDVARDHLAAVLTLTEQLPAAWPKIREWCSWQKARHEARQIGLDPIIAKLESSDGHTIDLPTLFERSFRRTLLFAAVENESVLREFFGREHSERIERFRQIDDKLANLARDLIRARLAAGIPRDQVQDDIPKAEIGLLRKEIGKRMRHIPVRQLLGRIPTLLPRLKPCVLMSPLSVAQYLEPSHETFDVVIFDEASQIPVWDAVGAIARGKQLIVVGDPKQLPPTNFFNSAGDEDEAVPEEHKDLESILDELLTNGLRHKRLQWHYRSRHEGLIAFSNQQYYANDLLTFPSPEAALGGVRFKHLPDARYDKGKSRTNLGEARALVDELVARLRKSDGTPRSYGVVTFSQAQQQLVENLLDEERRKFPEIEVHFGDESPVEGEPVFVKNLESVQGDERDIIIFSICYGQDETGRVSMNFGPLNRDGGERRLNVAITRAKHEVIVFSGLRADQIDLTRTQSRGVRDLKYFLDYAERGLKALAAAATSFGDAEPDSEFEILVADRIRAAGYVVHHQVGCSGYRIDLGVVDPRTPGRYLLGVECDGATYHRAATARDRDKLRHQVLEGLGWKLCRIWSTDWWHNPEAEIERIRITLDKMSK